MSVRNRRRWLVVSYDIPNDKRRTKVMKTLAGFGQRVQYSVFECELRSADVEKLRSALQRLIDDKQDDVRIYGFCDACAAKVEMLGLAQRHMSRAYVVI
ncbi:CRISPR-associated endonuclease Cas2 [Caldilinea sp.]|uniref:CRISPR-associated endonuclease Cas2 n=1 Tax=Caldilinea sp. TaxID=2293560 RepID=UPI0031CCC2F4